MTLIMVKMMVTSMMILSEKVAKGTSNNVVVAARRLEARMSSLR